MFFYVMPIYSTNKIKCYVNGYPFHIKGGNSMSKEKATQRINNQTAIQKRKPSNITPIIMIGFGILIAVCFGIVLHFLPGKDSESYNVVVIPDNVEQIVSQLEQQEYTPIGSYEVTMNNDWVFPDGNSPSTNAYVENSVNNQNTIFFTISLSGEEDDIYKSPYMQVGSHLENIKFDKKLDAGSYDAVLTYHLVDDAQKELSHVSVSITITVQK